MNAIRVLLYKSFARFVRNRSAVALTFIVPIAMIYIFGQVFGLNRKDSGPTGIPLGMVNASESPAMQKLVDGLRAEKAFRLVETFKNPDGTHRPLGEADLRPLIRDRAFRFALLIPRGSESDATFGVRLKVLSDPRNEIEAQTVNGLLQRAIFSHVPELLGQSLQSAARKQIGEQRLDSFNDSLAGSIAGAFGGDRTEIRDALGRGDFALSSAAAPVTGAGGGSNRPETEKKSLLSQVVDIETEQVVGKTVKSPDATRVVGGWAVMFLMFALNGAATSLFEEKKSGMFQRLLAAPVTRAQILWSRFIFGVVLGLVQLVTVFLFGNLLYGIDVFGHLGNLALVCVATAAACTAFGMFIASISSTPEAAQGLATFLILTMSACGGAWFPVSFMPEFMQKLAKFTLTYWAMDGFAQVLWAENTLAQILPTVGILAAIAATIMGLAVWRFNRGRLFD